MRDVHARQHLGLVGALLYGQCDEKEICAKDVPVEMHFNSNEFKFLGTQPGAFYLSLDSEPAQVSVEASFELRFAAIPLQLQLLPRLAQANSTQWLPQCGGD